MPTLHQLRVELEDRPGALARAAAVLADCGVNILDIAIHEIEGSSVVDELVVQAPDDWDLVDTRGRLDAVGVHLLSSVEARRREDPVVTALGWVDDLLADREEHAGLARVVARAAGATGACVLTAARAQQVAAGRAALDRGSPVMQRTADLPVGLASAREALRWLVAVPDPADPPELVVFATRPVSLRFTSTEVARVAAVVSLHRRLRTMVPV